MFIGHFGLSLVAKKAAPKVSLGMLFIATQFVDLLWPFLLITHVEKVAITPGYTKTNAFEFLYFPYTHSLLMGIVWGAVLGGMYWLFKRDTRSAVVIGLCVVSHWFLDLIVHTADLPITPFSDVKVGFGLWNHVIITLVVEFILLAIGIYDYVVLTKAKNKIGHWMLWVLLAILGLLQLANTFGPAPSDSIMNLFVSFTTLMIILIALAYWVDKNREVRL
jgi:hypothetical protein